MAALLLLSPSVAMFAWFHGPPGRSDRTTSNATERRKRQLSGLLRTARSSGHSSPLSLASEESEEATSHTINPNNQPSVKAGQVQREPKPFTCPEGRNRRITYRVGLSVGLGWNR